MGRSAAVTLKDIAREVGVSAMTVSAVLNDVKSTVRVSQQTRVRVLEAAGRMQYRPNAVARALSRRRMNTVGIVTLFQGPNDFNLVAHQILNGIIEAASRRNQFATICPIDNWTTDEHRILALCDGRLDGLILLGPALKEAFAEQLATVTDYVTIHNTVQNRRGINIDSDNIGGARLMTEHLISLGHRRIAHFAGDTRSSGTRGREEGYKLGLEAAGLPFDPQLVYPGFYTMSSGTDRALQMLGRRRSTPLPTAIFCANDAVASGAIHTLHKSGIEVPEDISVAGFDDSAVAQMSYRTITTVRQPLGAMGTAAMEVLLEQIDASRETAGAPIADRLSGETIRRLLSSGDAIAAQDGTVTFRCNIVERESVGPAPVA